MLDFETSHMRSQINENNLQRNYFFLKNYITSERAVSHNALYYQQLSIARYQISV